MDRISLRIFFFLIIFCPYTQYYLTSASEFEPKIIIIGAGAAGIAAASTLVDNGFSDITILEAKSRIGGRINTIPLGESVIDLGAEWVYGEDGNVVYELASKYDLLDGSPKGFINFTFIRSNAEVVPVPIWKRFRNITDQITISFVIKEFNDLKGSFGDYFKQEFNKHLLRSENADIDKKLIQEYYETFVKALSGDEGTESLDVISARDFAKHEICFGDPFQNWKNKGSIELLYLLMDTHKIGKNYGKLDGKIQLSRPVNEIQWQRDDHKALIKTKEGEEFIADHVIVTVPLGVLKENFKEMFKPNLPETKQKVIEALGFGLVNKIFLELKTSFWQPDWFGAYFLWREEDLQEIRGTEREWLLDIAGFFTVRHRTNLLFTWVTGKGARYMEDLTEEQIKVGCLYLLDRFIPSNKKEIVNIKMSKWATDPYFRGGVSFHSLETEEANVDNDQLAEPIQLNDNKPLLLFAGEATERKHAATVHGAVESGQREAKRLIDYYKRNKN